MIWASATLRPHLLPSQHCFICFSHTNLFFVLQKLKTSSFLRALLFAFPSDWNTLFHKTSSWFTPSKCLGNLQQLQEENTKIKTTVVLRIVPLPKLTGRMFFLMPTKPFLLSLHLAKSQPVIQVQIKIQRPSLTIPTPSSSFL